jgi:hypothetical protein
LRPPAVYGFGYRRRARDGLRMTHSADAQEAITSSSTPGELAHNRQIAPGRLSAGTSCTCPTASGRDHGAAPRDIEPFGALELDVGAVHPVDVLSRALRTSGPSCMAEPSVVSVDPTWASGTERT